MWMLLFIGLLIAGCARSEDLQPSTQRTAIADAKQARRLTQGEALYLRYCSECHGWEGRGDGPEARALGITAPSLRSPELFTRYNEAELTGWILFGDGFLSLPNPARIASTENDVSALVSHLKRLPGIQWDQVDRGRETYDSLCTYCHGLFGRGDGILPQPPPDLSTVSYQSQLQDEDLFRIISEGKGKMPGVGDVLKQEEIRSVIAYLRVLSPGYELYERFCATCHGSDGQPSVPPDDIFGIPPVPEENIPRVVFDESYFRMRTETWVRTRVRHMYKEKRALMPHFWGEMGASEIRNILSYLRKLPPSL